MIHLWPRNGVRTFMGGPRGRAWVYLGLSPSVPSALNAAIAAPSLQPTLSMSAPAEPVALPAPSRKPRRKRGAEAKASPLLPDGQGESE